MNKHIKAKLRTLLSVIILSCASTFVQAQPDPGGDPGGGNVPLDGGLSLLIAAGVGYAAKKRYDKRKQEEANQNKEDSGV